MNSISDILQDPNKLEGFLRETLGPGQFFMAKNLDLVVHPLREEAIPWEIFRGQLLDARHTRETQSFLSLHAAIRDDVGGEQPLLTLRVDSDGRHSTSCLATVHVTRWLHCRVWEAVEENGTIASREVNRWIEELVGSVTIAADSEETELLRDLRLLTFHAFVGLSRLPLNSVEAPLPLFSLGRAGFFPTLGSSPKPVNEPMNLLDFDLIPWGEISNEQVRRFELFLRTADGLALEAAADQFANRTAGQELSGDAFFRKVFNETSLTPYTPFVDNALEFAGLLFKRSALSLIRYAGLLFGLIRQTVFHLTAYDLVTFHHQGANYPDALMLDALVRNVLDLAGSHPEILRVKGRRRALLLGWWMHRFLEGMAVPDAPTSPGENRRLLPAPHQSVPEEQLNQPGHRKRRLFAERPIDWHAHGNLLSICLKELGHPDMLLELGTGLFLDRPFGSSKPPAALDLTPLLSYVLFSRKLAISRLDHISRLEPWLESTSAWAGWRDWQPDTQTAGVAVPIPRTSARTVKLQDCWRTSDDFVVRGATNQTVRQLQAFFNWEDSSPSLRNWHERGWTPIPMPADGSGAQARIVFYDADWNIQAECTVTDELGFQRRGALELPAPGLTTVHEGTRWVIAARFPTA